MGSSEVEICSKCGREIPRSEQAHVFKGDIVCVECDSQLRMNTRESNSSRMVAKKDQKVETKEHDLFQFFPKLAKQSPELAGVLSTLVLLILITVVYPAFRMLIFTEGKGKQPNELDIKSVVNSLPKDGIYSNPTGRGGAFRDSVNGLFEFEPPTGFERWESESSSWVEFKKKDITIRIQAFRPADELGRKDLSIKFNSTRTVTFDGVQTFERLYAFRGKQILWIRFKKHGFVHEMHINFSLGAFPKHSEQVLRFLRSYRALKEGSKAIVPKKEQMAIDSTVGGEAGPNRELPLDGIYSEVAGSGGSYKDPIHSFFMLDPPDTFRIVERRDKDTVTVEPGKPRAGERVPRSWIQFKRGEAQIGVIARKTWSDLETDFNSTVKLLQDKGAKVELKRYVTIDGVKGGEYIVRISDLRFHGIKYKKHGLDHSISLSGSPHDCKLYQKQFIKLVRSYRSLKSEQNVRQEDVEYMADTKDNIEAIQRQELVDKYDLSPEQKKIAVSYFKEQPCVYTTDTTSALKGSDDFLLFMEEPKPTPLTIEVKSSQEYVAKFIRLLVANKKISDIDSSNSRYVLASFAAIPHPSSKSKDDALLIFLGYHDPRFTVNTTPSNYFEAAPAPSFSPNYLPLFPKEFSAVFFVSAEEEATKGAKAVIMAASKNWTAVEFENHFSPKSNLIEVKVTIIK